VRLQSGEARRGFRRCRVSPIWRAAVWEECAGEFEVPVFGLVGAESVTSVPSSASVSVRFGSVLVVRGSSVRIGSGKVCPARPELRLGSTNEKSSRGQIR
jgi:hypothetical protein